VISALLSFLGGSAFRFLIGRLTDHLEKKQDHLQELDRMRLQEQIDQAKHARQQESIRLQHELGVQQIQVAGAAAVERAEAEAFAAAMGRINTPTGVRWIDGWNGAIRPAAATIALLLWLLNMLKAALVLTEWDKNLVASILGYYFADRHIGKAK
jgi:hypothetical protein